MSFLPSPPITIRIRWLLILFALLGTNIVEASGGRLELAYPGTELYLEDRPKKTKLSTWVAGKLWSALSVRDGVLFVEPVTETNESDWVTVSGKDADRLLEGKTPRRPPKPRGIILKPPADAVALARIDLDDGGSRGLNPGQYPSYIAPAVLKEGWTASAEVAGQKWKFYTRHEKRPDGKLLAGSLEIRADYETSGLEATLLLPKAGGMAFAKQELLWLGDLNGDMEPDFLLKRTLLTGEIDIILVYAGLLGLTSHDPDLPTSYFSSGVEPESNGFMWNKKWPMPGPIKFAGQGSFSIGEEEWHKKLYPNVSLPYEDALQANRSTLPPLKEPSSAIDPLALPIMLADRQFKLNGETIRFTLEHLPRASNQGLSSANSTIWGGSVVVRAFFRGKSQPLMEAEKPDSGIFTLSVGLIDGEPGIRVDHQPHYNNSFSQYWIYDKAESRFRRMQIEHSQGC